MSKTSRPVYLDLLHIQMPAAAITSILHRASGVLLALSLPYWIYLLQLSLRDEAGFEQVRALLDTWVVRVWVGLWVWAIMHHLLAGIRFLLIDIDIGVDRAHARVSAWWVNIGAIVVAMFCMGVLF